MANTVITANNICLQAITDIGLVASNDPTQVELRPTGLLSALEAPINATGIDGLRVTNQGDFITTHVKYHDAYCGTAKTGVPESCTPGTDLDPSAKFVEVKGGTYIYDEFTFSKNDFRTICETWGVGSNANEITGDRNTTFGRKLVQIARQVLQGERDYYLAQMYLKLGKYANGGASTPATVTEQTLKLFNNTDNMTPNSLGLFPIKKNYSLMGYQGVQSAMLVGGSNIEAWQYASPIFRGNVDGNDVSRAGGVIPYIDFSVGEYAQNTFGDAGERALTWIPSHNQAIRAHRYEGAYVTNRSTLLEDTIEIDGQRFDISIYTPDCGSVTVKVGRYNALFNINDFTVENCGGQASTLNWKLDCGALDCSVATQPISNS